MADPIAENGYFQTKLAEFNAKYDEFTRVLAAVLQADPDDPELRAEKAELIGRAEWIKSAIQKAQDAINWANQQMGQMSDALSGQLGVLPVVAIAAAVAAIAGAVAYMSSWISDAYIWSKKAQIAEQVKAAGGGPVEIRNAIAESGGGILGGLGTVGLLALVGAGWYLWSQRRG